MRFSERMGLTQPRTEVQTDQMDNALRSRLWNVFLRFFPDHFSNSGPAYFDPDTERFYAHIYDAHFKASISDLGPTPEKGRRRIKSVFDSRPAHEVYDLIEFIAGLVDHRDVKEACNVVLEAELSGYRFGADGLLHPLTEPEQLEELNGALQHPRDAVREHIRQAAAHFSDRQKPDYRNCIKESVSAVEALCRLITGEEKATLGQAVKGLEDVGLELHPALRKAILSLYGYTSDEGGLRHALKEDSPMPDSEEARFALLTCATIVNYLTVKAQKIGLL